MQQFKDQTLTLAAVCQVAAMVQKVSRQGIADEHAITTLLNSIINTSPQNTLEVYGDDVNNLKSGLQTLIAH